jgi:hypothetical protein
MRHDPAIASIVIMLRELKMHGMAQALRNWLSKVRRPSRQHSPSCPNCSRPRPPSGRCARWPTN